MRQILVALLAAALAIVPGGSGGGFAYAAPNCPYGSVNGVCIQGSYIKKGLSQRKATKPYAVKRCLIKSRCDYKAFYKLSREEPTSKKGFIFLAPILAGVPTAAVVVGVGILGIVSGAASSVGSKVADRWWPNKNRAKSLSGDTPRYAKAAHGPGGGGARVAGGGGNWSGGRSAGGGGNWSGRDHGGGWGHGPGWGRGPGWGGWGPRRTVIVEHNNGPDFLGPIIGGVAGFVLGRATAPSPEPQGPPPEPQGPPPVQEGTVVISPWTTDWYEFCNNKYKSFDAKTGFYTGFDGKQHFCQ